MIRTPVSASRRRIACATALVAAIVVASASPACAGEPADDAFASPSFDRPASAEVSRGPAHRGLASFYSHLLSGHRTASGERYDPEALTAAHRTLPMGTRIRVTNPANDRSVVVTVNDRGPVSRARLIDVSAAAAHLLGMKASGVARVEAQVLAAGAPVDEPLPLQADARTARDLILSRD